MIKQLKVWWDGLFASREPARTARYRRAQALRRLQDASQRNDDRDIGRALMELRQATNDELRAAL